MVQIPHCCLSDAAVDGLGYQENVLSRTEFLRWTLTSLLFSVGLLVEVLRKRIVFTLVLCRTGKETSGVRGSSEVL